MTGCEILAYLNGKTYLIKFRHDGMNIPEEYFVECPVDFANDPEKELVKMMDWWGAKYLGDEDYELDENIKRFVWVRECVWDRKSETADDFFNRATAEYCEPCIEDEEAMGFGYQCGYGDYGIFMDFEKKTVTNLGDGRINNIQKGDKVNHKVIAEYNRQKKALERMHKTQKERNAHSM